MPHHYHRHHQRRCRRKCSTGTRTVRVWQTDDGWLQIRECVCVCETCTVFVCARKLNGLLIALSHMPEPAGRAAHARLSQANRILNESLFLCVFCYFSYNTHIWFSFAWARLVHFAYSYTTKWKWNERHFDSRK